jgi:5-methylcytosine-specific restriction endonuclease McrA
MNEFQFLSKLKDPELLEATRTRVAEEKKATLVVLYHLREVERRRLHLARGFQSLYDFATRELGYSPAAAQRRIDAMRLLRELPELADKIQSGRIGLDSAARAQSYFKQESKMDRNFSLEQKREVLAQLEGKSSRECERHLASISSQPEVFLRPDSIRPVSAQAVEIRFVSDAHLVEKLDRVRELLSHQSPSMNLAELLEKMAELAIGVLEARKSGASKALASPLEQRMRMQGPPSPECTPAPEMKNVSQSTPQGRDQASTGVRSKSVSRYIPQKVQRAVNERDSRQCSYQDLVSGRKCGSRFRLELDHLIPFGRGGENTVENLALRCKSHNQLSAIRAYGERKILGSTIRLERDRDRTATETATETETANRP